MFSFCYMLPVYYVILYNGSIIKHNYVMAICTSFHILYSYALYIHTKIQTIIIKYDYFRNISFSFMTILQLVLHYTSFVAIGNKISFTPNGGRFLEYFSRYLDSCYVKLALHSYVHSFMPECCPTHRLVSVGNKLNKHFVQ